MVFAVFKKASIGRTFVYRDWEEPAKFSIDFGRTSVSNLFSYDEELGRKNLFFKLPVVVSLRFVLTVHDILRLGGRTQEMLIKRVSNGHHPGNPPPKKHGNLK